MKILSLFRKDHEAGSPVRTEVRTFPFPAGHLFRLVTRKGTVDLSPWERQEVEVSVRIEAPPGADSDHARRVVEATRVAFAETPSSLDVEVSSDLVAQPRAGRSWGSSFAFAHFSIRAPRALRLALVDRNSELRLGHFDGDFDFDVRNSSVVAERLSGTLRLRAHAGSFRFEEYRGCFDASVYKGDIAMSNLRIEGDCRLSSTKGRSDLTLARAQAFDLSVDLLHKAQLDSRLGNRAQDQVGGRLQDRIGGGGPSLSLSSVKGLIRLREA